MTSTAWVVWLSLATDAAPPPSASPPSAPPPDESPPSLSSTSTSTASPLPPALVGTWELDRERSDDPGPLLVRLGVPWIVRPLASRVAQHEIILEPGIVIIRVSGQSRDEVLTVDGKTPSHSELVGSPLVLVSRVDGDAIVSEGTLTIDGRPLATTSVRRARGRELHVTNTFGKGADAIVFRRVFQKVAPPTIPR
jgi:hypothetical protein